MTDSDTNIEPMQASEQGIVDEATFSAIEIDMPFFTYRK